MPTTKATPIPDAAAKRSAAELAIAEIANVEALAAHFLGSGIEDIKANVVASVHWPEFCRLVAAGQVPLDFAGPGVVSRRVFSWAWSQNQEADL